MGGLWHFKLGSDIFKQARTGANTLVVQQTRSDLNLCVPLQVKLSRLCEQDKILKDLEIKISSLKEDKVSFWIDAIQVWGTS